MAQLNEIKTKIDNEQFTAYLSPAQQGCTSYQICLSGDGYIFTVNRGFSSKPDKEHYSKWDQLLERLPGWARQSTKWEVM